MKSFRKSKFVRPTLRHATVRTELVDLVEFGGDRVTRYYEFFVPCADS